MKCLFSALLAALMIFGTVACSAPSAPESTLSETQTTQTTQQSTKPVTIRDYSVEPMLNVESVQFSGKITEGPMSGFMGEVDPSVATRISIVPLCPKCGRNDQFFSLDLSEFSPKELGRETFVWSRNYTCMNNHDDDTYRCSVIFTLNVG